MIRRFYYSIMESVREKMPQLFSLIFRFRTIIKYLISGGTAALVDLVFLYFFTDTIGLWYILSSVLAFLIAFGVSFSLQKFWTFRDHSTDRLYQQASIYLGVSFFGNLVINTCLMYVFVDIFQIHYFLSQIITSGLIAVASFFIYRNFVFKRS